MMNECTYHGIHNSFFDQINHDRYVRKEWEGWVNCSLSSLLSCRLRNGFTVNEVKLEQENQLQVKLTLPWKINTFIHYVIKSAMSVDSENINGATTSSTQASSPQDPNCHVEVFLDGMCLYVFIYMYLSSS